jgi:hypothetical protein
VRRLAGHVLSSAVDQVGMKESAGRSACSSAADPIRRAVAAAAVVIVAACGPSGSPDSLSRLNADPVFRLSPPTGEITRSVFPTECPSSSGSTTAGNEVAFTFASEPAQIVEFYRAELGKLGWEIEGERPQGRAVAIDASKALGGDRYSLTVTVGSGGGAMYGTTPPGACSAGD